MRNVVAGLMVGWMAVSGFAADRDRDHDGVSDALEEALIERFQPHFLVDVRDCAELPAEFQAFSKEPRVRDRNGAIYARVFPTERLGSDVWTLEVQYYHLWERDCGRLNAHPLDVEHVSVLVVAATPHAGASEWTARYWYAAAHEDTVCDTSNAARAEAIDAVTRGPNVFISAGKHASYLSTELCGQRGCGGDRCGEMVSLPPRPIINLGEAGVPMNGALWIASPDWPLSEKLGTDFDSALVAELDTDTATVLARANGHWRPAQFTISIGGDAIGALSTAGHHGGDGLAEAEDHTGSALGKGFRALGRALGHAARALGLGKQ